MKREEEKKVTVDGGNEIHCSSFLSLFFFFFNVGNTVEIPGSEGSQALSACHSGEGCLVRR
jgi:hypothetical protein